MSYDIIFLILLSDTVILMVISTSEMGFKALEHFLMGHYGIKSEYI